MTDYKQAWLDGEQLLRDKEEQIKAYRDVLKKIASGQTCWTNDKKRAGCSDFEDCDCAELEAKAALVKGGK